MCLYLRTAREGLFAGVEAAVAEGGEHGVVHGLTVVAEHVVDPVVLCLRAAAGGVVACDFGVVGKEVGRHVVAAVGVVMD